MLRHAFLGVVVCLAYAAAVSGQEPPKPGPEHEKLKELEGTWDAVMEMGGQESKGKTVYKSVNGGLWLLSDHEGELAGMKFEGHGLDGYDQTKKKYVSIWTDSMGTAPMFMEGDYDAKNKMVVFSGEMPVGEGKSVKVKSTHEAKDKDHRSMKMYMVMPDNSEQLMFTINYTRRN